MISFTEQNQCCEGASTTPSTTDDLQASIHDNIVEFLLPGIANFGFTLKGFSISSGQPWQGTTASTSGNSGVIDAKAGRHGTSAVAGWFDNQLGGGQCLGLMTAAQYPSDLNFAFYGDMSFDYSAQHYVLANVVIGQGYDGRNNWWFGGPGWSRSGDYILTNGQWFVGQIEGNPNTFELLPQS